MQPVKEKRASERAYETLLEEIQSGVLSPGTVLAEVNQAERLGVSRTPMRTAISKLISDGLAKQLSPRTTVVTGFDLEDIQRLFEARRALEESAARLAAERGDRKKFKELEEGLARVEIDSDEHIEEYYRLINQFDEEIDRAVDNDYLISALSMIRTHLVRARRLARDNHERLAASVAEHRLIAHAIASGDQDLAVGATHVHLHNALTAIKNSLTEGK